MTEVFGLNPLYSQSFQRLSPFEDTFEAMMAAYEQDSGPEAVVDYFAELGWLDRASV